VYSLVDPGFLSRLNFYEASWFVSHRADITEKRQTNKGTDGRRDAFLRPSVRSSLRVLDDLSLTLRVESDNYFILWIAR